MLLHTESWWQPSERARSPRDVRRNRGREHGHVSLVDRWDDDKAHAAVLEHALRSKMLSELAGRYRALSNDPARAPVATKQLDRIVVAATEMLMSMKTPAPGNYRCQSR